MIENAYNTRKEKRAQIGITANKKKNTDDSSLLDVFDNAKPKRNKSAKKPLDDTSTYKFGRPETPQVLSRSISKNPSRSKLEEPKEAKREISPKPSLSQPVPKKAQSKRPERSVSVSKSKNIEPEELPSKSNKNLRQSEIIQSTQTKPLTSKSKSPTPSISQIEKPKVSFESVKEPFKADKSPNNYHSKIDKPSNSYQIPHPIKELQQPFKNQERSKSPVATQNSKSQPKKYETTMSGRYGSIRGPDNLEKQNNKENLQSHNQKSGRAKQNDDLSKSKDKLKSNVTDYKPDTKDLFQRLNEYTKFKENVNILNQPEPPKKEKPIEIPTTAVDQAKERAEHFLKKQIDNFKDKKKPVSQTSDVDLQKVVQPRHKKQAVEIKDQCSFQPLLAKKSMQIIDKIVIIQ